MAIFNVTNQTELTSAISNAVGGDAVLIAPGNYSNLNINKNFSSEVVFAGTDPQNYPVIAGADLNSQNLVIREVEFKYTWQLGDAALSPLVKIEGSDGVIFDTVRFVGDWIGTGGSPLGGANGLGVQSNSASHNIWWKYCSFERFTKCVKGNHCSRHRFTQCEFFDVRSDGATYDHISGTEAYDYPGYDTQSNANFGLVVENCHGHDWQRAIDGAHPDFWQIQRTTGQGSHWVYFLYNVYDVGTGNYGQIMFGGQSGQANNATTRHSNFHHIGNTVYSSHVNTIAYSWIDNVVCQYNTLILTHLDAGDGPGVPTINYTDSTNVLIDSNIACTINHSTGGEYTVTNNVTTGNDADYDSYFNYLASGYSGITNPVDAYNDYQIRDGSALDVTDVGSRMMLKEGGWNSPPVEVPPTYLGGYRAPVGLQTLPSGSVSASVTAA